jgi:hypothetical protein
MDPRLAVLLPVPSALAHAATLRRQADYHAEVSDGAWADRVDMLRDLSIVVIGFAVGLVVLAVLARLPGVRRAARWVLVAGLVSQVGWLVVSGFLAPDFAATGTLVALMVFAVVAVVNLRRPQSRSA